MSIDPPQRPLRVLITNNTLGARAGSELYARDIALSLMRLGHLPVLYSPVLGAVAEELEKETIPVVDNLDKLAAPPDIIHGQHHHETMTAGLRFRDRPMIYVCHGWLPWEERPPVFPTIRRYVAVDDLCRERLLTTEGVDAAKVTTIYNFADMERFRERPPLPDRPKSALIFSNYAPLVHDEIRAACQSVGIERIDIVGGAVGNVTSRPEDLLPQYDVVFAKGRSAIEALACGCAVVVADYSRFAGLVTMNTLDHLRRFNFGVRTLQNVLTRDALRLELEQYSADDARAVSRTMRAEAQLSQAAKRYADLYRDVLNDWDAARDAPSAEATIGYATRYLRWLAPTIKDRHGVEHYARALAQEIPALREIDQKLSASLTSTEQRNSALSRQVVETTVQLNACQVSLASLERDAGATYARLAERETEYAGLAAVAEEASRQLGRRDQELATLADRNADLSARLAALENELSTLRRELADAAATLSVRDREIARIKASRAWRAVQSYGRLKQKIWTR
ncbi:MAG: glycosyltransferase [Pseudomonadota bacterium]